MAQTPRLAIPHIVPGQVAKEVTHNQGLERLDLAVQPVVMGASVVSPPGDAATGDCYIVGTGATDAWAGHDEAVAMMGEGGWIFLSPFEGLSVFDSNAGLMRQFLSGVWQVPALSGIVSDINGDQVVGARQAAVSAPSGGSTKDTQARTAISGLIDRLVAHGLIAAN